MVTGYHGTHTYNPHLSTQLADLPHHHLQPEIHSLNPSPGAYQAIDAYSSVWKGDMLTILILLLNTELPVTSRLLSRLSTYRSAVVAPPRYNFARNSFVVCR